jgi:DNA-binding NtrC family response regulator
MLLDQAPSRDGSQGEHLIGVSAAMRQVIGQVGTAAVELLNVLVCGEPGSGRETIARAIHSQSRSNAGAFIKVDCAKNPPDLEALLFATSGDRNQTRPERRTLERVRRDSLLYQSRGGTLFLQNVVDLPARVQFRLARVLRDREVVLMGAGKRIELNHRVMTAGDGSLDMATQDGRILADLHKRLCAIRLDVPPLRERREDIPALAAHFVAMACSRANVPCKELSESASSMLAALPWRRGNGTELRSLLEGLVVRVQGPSIGLQDVLAHVQLDAQAAWFPIGASLRDARARFEREYIAAVLAQHHGRIPDAARTLGIQRSNLYRTLRRLKVQPRPKHR